jgi:hypothetical protein
MTPLLRFFRGDRGVLLESMSNMLCIWSRMAAERGNQTTMAAHGVARASAEQDWPTSYRKP